MKVPWAVVSCAVTVRLSGCNRHQGILVLSPASSWKAGTTPVLGSRVHTDALPNQ